MISVFIVEDDIFILKLYELFLKSSGFSIIGKAKNGDEAVRFYKSCSTKPDVIIMDQCMPVKNGLDASREILQINNEAKIIIVSADTSIKGMIKSVGAKLFIEKPFSLEYLVENIYSVLEIYEFN